MNTHVDSAYFLTICIPTYNRYNELKRNLSILEKQIEKYNLKNVVRVFVSDNASSDETNNVLKQFAKDTILDFEFFSQETNIGFEANLLSLTNKVNSQFIMLLGDDDYLHEDYIKEVVRELKEDESISCVFPNYIGVTPDGEYLYNRDEKGKRTLTSKGFQGCIVNLWKAHQLSGLTFRKDDILELYQKRGLHNLYPQVFMLGQACLRGKSLYLPEYPTKVTQVPQVKKDWSYGDDGLLSDFFNNIKYLDISYQQRVKLEISLIESQKSRVLLYEQDEIRNRVIENILFNKNISFVGRLQWVKYLIMSGFYTGKRFLILKYVFMVLKETKVCLKL